MSNCPWSSGDALCGKSGLVAKMAGADRTPVPSILEHNFLTVHANEDNRQTYQLTSSAALFGAHDSTNLPLWVWDGRAGDKFANLFEFVFPKQLTRCVLVLCASITHPEHVLESLERWYKVAEQAVKSHFSEEVVAEAKAAREFDFRQPFLEFSFVSDRNLF